MSSSKERKAILAARDRECIRLWGLPFDQLKNSERQEAKLATIGIMYGIGVLRMRSILGRSK